MIEILLACSCITVVCATFLLGKRPGNKVDKVYCKKHERMEDVTGVNRNGKTNRNDNRTS